ncbi:hypothetical protein V2J09_010118 [Rumex salicifolius]
MMGTGTTQKNTGFSGGNKRFDVPPLYRNLHKADLGGVIFGCKNETKEECLSRQLFGLPMGHIIYVKNIGPGMPLFLFNYSDKRLYGIYEAASSGDLNIDPYAWTKDGLTRTGFPAQVTIRRRVSCQPLSENQFRPIIAENYYGRSHFWFELDHAQVSRLIQCFSSGLQVTVLRNLPKRRQIYVPLTQKKSLEAGEEDKSPKQEISSDENFGGPDSSVFQEGNYQSSESSLRSENDEKEVIYQKLLELVMESKSSHDTHEGETTNENKTIMVDDGDKIKEVVKGEDVDAIDTPVSQLLKEMKELKAYNREHALKMNLIEKKLIELEAENQCLRRRCEMWQSCSDQSDFQSANDETELPIDPHLDSDTIFLFGGNDGNKYLSSVDSYSFSRDLMRSLRPMLSVRAYSSVARVSDNFYIVAGGDGTWYDTVEAYNPFNDEWTSQPKLKEAAGSLATATVDNRIFAMGGGNGICCFSDMQMLDPDVGRWISGRSMLRKRFALGAVTLNDVIYAVGGYDGENYLRSAERFDPREHSWSNIASMNSKRSCHNLVVLNEKIYALGGYDGSDLVPSVEVFDPRLGKWMFEGPMNYARGYGSAVAINNAIYVMGGLSEDGGFLESIERYKEGKGWQLTNLKGIGKRSYASAMVL